MNIILPNFFLLFSLRICKLKNLYELISGIIFPNKQTKTTNISPKKKRKNHNFIPKKKKRSTFREQWLECWGRSRSSAPSSEQGLWGTPWRWASGCSHSRVTLSFPSAHCCCSAWPNTRRRSPPPPWRRVSEGPSETRSGSAPGGTEGSEGEVRERVLELKLGF